MDNTCAHHSPHTKLHHCTPYRILDIWLFCYQPIRTDMQMRYQIYTFSAGSTFSLMPTTSQKPSFMEIGHCALLREAKVGLPFWLTSNLHPSIHTCRHHDNKNLSGPSSIADSQQKDLQWVDHLEVYSQSFFTYQRMCVFEKNLLLFFLLQQNALLL